MSNEIAEEHGYVIPIPATEPMEIVVHPLSEPHGFGHEFECPDCGELIRRGSINALLEHVLYHEAENKAKLTRLEKMMTESLTDQQKLEADVTADNAVLDDIEAEVLALKAQPGAEAIDFTSMDALTARLRTDDPGPAAPPADAPTGATGQTITAGTTGADLPGAVGTDAGMGTDAPVDSQTEINSPIGGVGSPAGADVPVGQGEDTTPVSSDPAPVEDAPVDGSEQPSGDAEPVAEPETPMVGGS